MFGSIHVVFPFCSISDEIEKKHRISCLTGFSIAYTKLCQAGKRTHIGKDTGFSAGKRAHIGKDTGLSHQIQSFRILLDKRPNLSANLEALRLRILSYYPHKKSTINDPGAHETQGV
jgi:hypothetical protein